MRARVHGLDHRFLLFGPDHDYGLREHPQLKWRLTALGARLRFVSPTGHAQALTLDDQTAGWSYASFAARAPIAACLRPGALHVFMMFDEAR